MAKISLRAYVHEIEGLITKGQLDEAVAHCQYILQGYPKLLAAYRLLGKAYLEGQRYGDASDVFLRVLSAAPDDYMAHVGMSMIREDEANLNAALWHMERAFEAQPSNGAIQGELRRLYGRRDGVEPPKVRMTRGALARMYARGNLYQQSIAELRAALAEDPQRPDLQVLLARMYFMGGHRVEAVDTCSALIKKLPYCLEANRLLAHILPETGRKEDTQIYSQRVAALDPYMMYAKPASVTGEDVAENIVMLDHMDYMRSRSAVEAPSQPAWAASLGVAVDKFEKQEESIPDWLAGDARGGASEAPQPEETAPEEAESTESLIPDWMKQAGWEPGTGVGEEGPTIEEPGAIEDAGEIAPGQMPDWLKSMAPSGILEESDVEEAGGEEEVLPWLQEKTPGPSDTVVNWLQKNQLEAEDSGDLISDDTAPTEIPDWMKDLAPEQPPADETTPAAVEPGEEQPPLEEVSQADIPEWMSGLEPETGATAEALPDWMQETEIAAAPEAEAAEEATLPDWLKEMEMIDPSSMVEPSSVEEQPSAEETALVQDAPAAEADADLPDWLKELTPEGAEELQPELEEFHAEVAPTEIASAVAEAAVEEPVEEADLPAEESTLPDWLKQLEAGDQLSATEQPSAEIPAEAGAVAEQALELPVEAAPWTGEAEPSALTDAEAGLAWLESLAARQGVPEEELTTRPDERPADIPEWLKDSAAQAPVDASQPEWLAEASAGQEELFEEAETEALALQAENIPDWLKAMAIETPAQSAIETPAQSAIETPAEPAIETPAEQAFETPTDELPVETESGASVEGALAPAELPDWLMELEATEEPSAEIPADAETVIGAAAEPLAELVVPELPHEELAVEPLQPAEAGVPDLSDPDAALAWLESLAAKQGVPEDELITRPEERPAEAPAWVQDMGDASAKEQPITEEQPAAEEGAPAGTPDWLAAIEEPVYDEPAGEAGVEEIPESEPEREEIFTADTVIAPTPVFEAPKEAAPMPDWLKELTAEDQPAEEAEAEEQLYEAGVQPFAEELPIEEPLAEGELLDDTQQTLIEEQPAVQGGPAEIPVDEALAWLESLAAKQGVSQDELMSKPEERPSEAPAWAMEMETVTPIEPSAEEPAVTPPLAEEIRTGYDEIKEAEAAADAIIHAAAQTTGLTMPPGFEIPKPAVEHFEPALADQEEEAFAPPPVEIPSWVSEAAQAPAEEGWTPPVEEPAVEEEPVEAVEAINLNTASLVDLESLPGIGFVLAQNILDHREQHGDFASVEDLAGVPGFTPDLMDEILPYLSVAAPEPEPELEPEPVKAPSAVITSVGEDREQVQAARLALAQGKQADALEIYSGLIRRSAAMDDVIYDLNQAVSRQPRDPNLWQALGDAYMYSDKLQEALDAYNKAEECMR